MTQGKAPRKLCEIHNDPRECERFGYMCRNRKAPNLAAAVEKDLSSDLKKVGGFFKGLWGFTQRAERAIEAAKQRGDTPQPPEDSQTRERSAPRAPASAAAAHVVEASSCDVCGGTRLVGGAKKIPCPACK